MIVLCDTCLTSQYCEISDCCARCFEKDICHKIPVKISEIKFITCRSCRSSEQVYTSGLKKRGL